MTSEVLRSKSSSDTHCFSKPNHLSYHPSVGSVTESQFTSAVREFQRTQFSRPVLIASKVNISQWLTSGIIERMWNVFVEAKFEDDVLTSSTIGELWIVKCQGGPDGDVLAGISYQLYRYCEQFMPLLSVGGGDMVLSRGTRRADTAVRIRPSLLNGQSDLPRMLVGIKFSNRTVDQAHQFILGYFAQMSCLQAVVFFAFYPQHVDGSYAALAVLYRRGAGGEDVVINDAVPFGSANISHSAFANHPSALKACNIRCLPLAPRGADIMNRNPWSSADRAAIRVPGEDFFFLQPPSVLLAGAPIPAPACEIDLWKLLRDLHGLTWK